MESLSTLVTKVKRLHLNYNMITSLYMMEPMERTIISENYYFDFDTIFKYIQLQPFYTYNFVFLFHS
jgi:hypothetical protein